MIYDYLPNEPPTAEMIAAAEAKGSRPRRLNGYRYPGAFPMERFALWFEEWDAASQTWVKDEPDQATPAQAGVAAMKRANARYLPETKSWQLPEIEAP